MDALLDDATKTERVLIDIDNPDDVLHAGMFATVRLQLLHRDHALLIPNEALVHEGDSTSVYLVAGDVAKRTPVKTGYSDSNSIEILSGLKESDKVVLPGSLAISDGMKIKTLAAEAKGH